MSSSTVTPHLRCRLVHYRSHQRQPPHKHEHSNVSIVLAGNLSESVGGRTELIQPFNLILKSAGVIHENRFGSYGAVLLAIEFHETFPPIFDREENRWRWIGEPSEERFLTGALLTLLRSDRPEPLIEALLNRVSAWKAAPAAPPWLRKARRELDAVKVTGERDCVTRVATRAGVHRVTLARAFRGHYGSTIRDYLRWQRVRAAAEIILDPSIPLSEIALQSGFFDQSHLNRHFRSAVGVTPGQYRSLLLGR